MEYLVEEINCQESNINDILIEYIYVNKNSEIYNIKSHRERIEENKIKKERILYLIKNYQYNLNEKHKLCDILQFNIELDINEMKEMILEKNKKNYLKRIMIIDDIKFNNTIKILEKENALIFILREIEKTDSNTRRIIINNNKKTRRKR